MTIDERLEALTMNLELQVHESETLRHSIADLRHGIADLKEKSAIDAENIRALARIAEIHERRLTDFEDQQ
jgi:hypothetical protein